MERRDQVLRLQAQLEAKRLELAKLQQRVHKAEVCRRSQVLGHSQCKKQDSNDDQALSTASKAASQDLVRSLTDPHSPIWLSGQHYPAQYLIRQTRSMSRAAQRGVVIMPQPPPSTMVAMEDFDLPDDNTFYPLKQQRIRNSPSCNQLLKCRFVDGDCSVELKCTHHIQCVPGETCQNERTDGRMVVKEGGTFAVLFDDNLTVCPNISSNLCYSYSVSKVIKCFDYVSTGSGTVLTAIAHQGEIGLLVLSAGQWEQVSLPTDHLAWPVDLACQYMSMSQLSTGSILIAVYCCDEVCVWRVGPKQWRCEVVCSFSLPRLCSIFLLHDMLLATTTDHRLIIYCVVPPPPSPLRDVPLSCCCSEHNQQAVPFILAATNKNNCLLIVLTFKTTCEAHNISDAGWIVALGVGDHTPYLLHTYNLPQPTLDLMLQAYTTLDKLWRLVGVADGRQLVIWTGTQPLPSVRIMIEGSCVISLAWDTVSNSCLVLDKFQQVHCFQNTTAQCSQ